MQSNRHGPGTRRIPSSSKSVARVADLVHQAMLTKGSLSMVCGGTLVVSPNDRKGAWPVLLVHCGERLLRVIAAEAPAGWQGPLCSAARPEADSPFSANHGPRADGLEHQRWCESGDRIGPLV
jgi:hypothetical protein